MTENEITEIIIGCAIKVHNSLGPGLLESAYEECMNYELRKTILENERQKPLPLIYKELCGSLRKPPRTPRLKNLNSKKY